MFRNCDLEQRNVCCPKRHRAGNGYVYDSMDTQSATRVILQENGTYAPYIYVSDLLGTDLRYA